MNTTDKSKPDSHSTGCGKQEGRHKQWSRVCLSETLSLHEGPCLRISPLMVKNLPAMWETLLLIPGSGRSPGEGNGNPLQYSCLKNSMDSQRRL